MKDYYVISGKVDSSTCYICDNGFISLDINKAKNFNNADEAIKDLNKIDYKTKAYYRLNICRCNVVDFKHEDDDESSYARSYYKNENND